MKPMTGKTVLSTGGIGKAAAMGLLDEHVRHCVREPAEAGDQGRADEMVTEATKAIESQVRS